MKTMSLLWAVLLLGATAVAHAANFTPIYMARTGDLNGDGRTDIYLDYHPKIVPIMFDDLTIPVPTTQRKVADFVLQQNAQGGFDIVAITGAQKSTVRQWAASAVIQAIACDMDTDGNRDVILQGVPAAIPGALNVIVFAPSAANAVPAKLRVIDSSVQMFINDLNGFAQSGDHYYDGGWLPATVIVPWPANYYDCGWQGVFAYWEGSIEDLIASTECDYMYTIWQARALAAEQLDLSRFSATAYSLNKTAEPFLPSIGTTTFMVDLGSAQVVLQRMSEVLGTPVAPDAPPAGPIEIPPDVAGDTVSGWRLLGLGRLLGLIGGLLYPSEIAPDRERHRLLYHHYSYMNLAVAGSFDEGLWDWTWVANPPQVRGLQAQQLYVLPIHDPQDSPPNILFNVWLDEDTHRFVNTEPAQIVFWIKTQPNFTKQRTGGGVTTLLEKPVTSDQLAGPFPVSP